MTADRLIAGRYRLTDPIGAGAMGVVWRATDVRLRRTVAVKQLLLGPGLSRSAALEAKSRAMREGRIAARLHHPNAITVFDVAEEDGQPWLVMEYMDAPSLAAKLSDKRTLAPAEVAKIGAQAASALAAAHDAGIMHRDVKPANLLVGNDGTVKITDFGISRAVGDVTVTATGFLAGTPAYLAPEVARGEDPEPASDVFALGSTLYTAVQGRPPFGAGDNPLAVLHAVARAQVEEPENAGVLGPVLMLLLAPTIDARPTMREAKEALEAVAAGRDPGLAPPVLTKVMPAPGAPGATAILPQSGAAGSTGRPSGTAATAPAALAGPIAPQPFSAQPPIPPQGGETLPGGTSRPERGRIAALAAGAVIVVLIVAGIIATVTAGNRDEGGAAAASSVVPPASQAESSTPPANAVGPVPEETAAPTTASGPGSASATSSSSGRSTTPSRTSTIITTTPSGPATPDRIISFVQGYYGMLPGNVSGAWSQLSPGYQAQTGQDSYVSFWGTIRSVSVGAVTPNGSNRAVVALTYTLKNGTTTSENRWIEVVGDSGRLQIAGSGT
ncbi:protein kinase [Nocardia sp. NBC_01730]|uniref:serine/threonine-protein kinase n=1 Tax=Nocardia sp. NBC_01730 TaxID=2975998 RepID=UPI002E15D87A|nr:protein kinase [Nocardia sp. NBC_01730]